MTNSIATPVASSPPVAPAAAPPTAGDLLAAPMTPEAARQAIEERKADKDFYKRLSGNDAELKAAAMAEWTKLHQTAYPAPQQIASTEDVNSQAAARNAERWNSYIGSLKTRFPLSAEQEAEIRGGVIPAEAHAWAREEKDRLIKDPGFRTKLLSGDRAANRDWGLVTSMLSLRPVK